MAGNQPTSEVQDFEGPSRRRRKAVRYAVPVAVAGVAAATIGIGSALASTGDPDLPKISAQDLIAKMAQSDTQQMSGSVKINTDLGLPSLPSGLSFGDGDKKGEGKKGGSAPSPQSKLTELAAGSHTLRLAVDGPDKQRVSIVERAAEYSVVRNGDDVWAYDSSSNTVHHSKDTKAGKAGKGGKDDVLPKDLGGASPQELAKKVLAAADETTAVTVDGTAKVAGRDAYQLLIKPKADDTTVGSIRIAVDAKNGVPLKFTLAAKGGGKAVVDAAFTKVDFGKPGAGTFDFTPPKGAKVTESGPEKADRDHKADHKDGREGGLPGMLGMPGGAGGDVGKSKVLGKGWSSIAEFDAGKDAGSALNGKGAGKKSAGGKGGADAQALLDGFGTKVSGDFGSGRVYSTRIVNALMTDDGKVYIGAVTKDALVKAANAK
ncbi:outer membrane lipoprotein carrier protein LolA [Streptomyces abikoensis]|uniref:LolA family protein n=1 Tax=Streptomyces abikoensis TaxID=97398 RepID=UPI00371171B3